MSEESAQALLDVLDGRAAPLKLNLTDNKLSDAMVQRATSILIRKSLDLKTLE